MRIKVTKVSVYPFDELSEDAKEKAVAGLWNINIEPDWWWESIFEDAETVKLKLTEFELDRGSYCRGEFIGNAEDTARAILHNHGETCETYKTVIEFNEDLAKLHIKYPFSPDADGEDVNEFDRKQEQEEIDAEFLKSILEDYRIILQKEYEYLAGEDAIVEMIKANEYEFTEDGVLA